MTYSEIDLKTLALLKKVEVQDIYVLAGLYSAKMIGTMNEDANSLAGFIGYITSLKV